MAAIIIVDREPDFLERLGSLLGRQLTDDVQRVATTAALEDAVSEETAVVIYGPSVPLRHAMESVETLTARFALLNAVLVAPKVTVELLRDAMRAGFRDVIAAESTFGEVASSVADAFEDAQRRREALGVASAESAREPQRGKVITVFSTKGGVGKTVIACNLGVVLAEQLRLKTVLLDLDLEFGDTGIVLQLEPTRTITDVVRAYDRLDGEMLDGFLTKHRSGLNVLLAPVRPEDAETVTVARASRIISMLRERYDVVIIDTPATMSDTVLAAIDKSDEVLAVAMMDVASLKNMRISLQKLKQLGYGNGLVKVVLNRADSKVWLEPADMERAIETEITARIPSDRIVPRSVNKGVPFVTEAPRSLVAKSIVGLARQVANGKGGDTR